VCDEDLLVGRSGLRMQDYKCASVTIYAPFDPKLDFCILTPVTSKSRSDWVNVLIDAHMSDAPTM